MIEKKPLYVVGGWEGGGTFETEVTTYDYDYAVSKLKKIITNKGYWNNIKFNLYKLYPEQLQDYVIDSDELKFYNEAQAIIDNCDLRCSFQYEKVFFVNDEVDEVTDLGIGKDICLDTKRKVIKLKVRISEYSYYKTNPESKEEAYQEIKDSLYCVEIPRIKKALRLFNSNLRFSIVDGSGKKLIPGFITKD